MISLFITNSDTSNVSKNGSQIQLSLNPPIILDPNKKWYACVTECDIVYCFPNVITGVNDVFSFFDDYILDKNYHLDQGLYTLDALQKEFNSITQETLHNSNIISMSEDT